jgi:hypothetical protein
MLKQKRYRLQLLAITVGLSLLFGMPAYAASTNENISQAVTQSYNAASSVQLGMIVELEPKDPNTVEPLTAATLSNVLGVVVPSNDAAVTLTPQKQLAQQVFVATAGRYNVLVSTQNGPIAVGDEITISSVAGIGMRADDSQNIVLGTAASDFDGVNSVISKVNLKNSAGQTSRVSLGQVAIDLNIAHNPLQNEDNDYVPAFLSKAAVSVVNHPVSVARIYLSILTLLASAIVTGTLLYSGVRSGMQAIGRNPLSRKSIIRSLIQTVTAGLIIFIVGIFGVYLLLKL